MSDLTVDIGNQDNRLNAISNGKLFYREFCNKLLHDIKEIVRLKQNELKNQEIENFRSTPVEELIKRSKEINKVYHRNATSIQRPLTIQEAMMLKKQLNLKIDVNIDIDIDDHKKLKDCDKARKKLAMAEFIRINQNIAKFGKLNPEACKSEIMYFLDYSFFAWMSTLNDFTSWKDRENAPTRPDYINKLDYYQMISDLINEAIE